MKTVFSVIGLLTLAQWLFIGLLHLFLTVQDKRSPETMNKLHDVPVIGGYFPRVHDPAPDPELEARDYADSIRTRLREAKKYYDLPPAFSEEELVALIEEIRDSKLDLERREQGLAQRQLETETLLEELGSREGGLLKERDQLDELAKRLTKQQEEITFQKKVLEVDRDAVKEANLKKVAKILNSMKPAKIADLLVGTGDVVTPRSDLEEQLEDAAWILSFMEPEVVAQVFQSMERVDYIRIQEKLEKLPPKTAP